MEQLTGNSWRPGQSGSHARRHSQWRRQRSERGCLQPSWQGATSPPPAQLGQHAPDASASARSGGRTSPGRSDSPLVSASAQSGVAGVDPEDLRASAECSDAAGHSAPANLRPRTPPRRGRVPRCHGEPSPGRGQPGRPGADDDDVFERSRLVRCPRGFAIQDDLAAGDRHGSRVDELLAA
jgi:hypothetical protein